MLIEELSGANVVIIDDTEREIRSIRDALTAKEIKSELIIVDLAGDEIHHDLIESIQLVFLDLNYSDGIGSRFDPYFCANILAKLIPPGKKYYLVAWTKDPDKTEIVIEILKEINLLPISYISKRKSDYRFGDEIYDAERLLKELDREFDAIKKVEVFYGEILDIEDDFILINCLVDADNLKYQIRRFDKSPFENYIEMKIGGYITITCITTPGSRLFEFNNELADMSKYFYRKDPFEGLGDSAFFKD